MYMLCRVCVLQGSNWLVGEALNHQGGPVEGPFDDLTRCPNNPWSYVSNSISTLTAPHTDMLVQSPPLVLEGMGLALLNNKLDGACLS